MSRRPLVLVAWTILLLAGCGGTTHAPASGAASASATRPGSGAGSGGSAAGAGATTTHTSGSTDVRLPATFTVSSGDRLTPATVSSPASVAIQVTVVSGDDKSHRALLRTPTPHTLSVPAGASSSALVAGLRPGRYALLIDGVARGALVVGGQPGP